MKNFFPFSIKNVFDVNEDQFIPAQENCFRDAGSDSDGDWTADEYA